MGVVVRQKVKGKGEPWWVFISHDGQRTSRRVGSKQAAEAVAKEISAQLQLGKFDFQPKQAAPSFRTFAETWFNTTVKATCKPSTASDYEGILNNHLYPVFADMPITDLNRGKIKEFLLGKLNAGFSHSTAAHMKNVLSGVLSQALDHEIIQANAALGIKKIANGKAQTESINPLTDTELDHLLQTVYRSKKYRPHFCLFLLLARTGMRIGEALVLQWGDIDFNSRFIEVKRSIVRGHLLPPKSGKSRRVDMSPQLTEALLSLEVESKKKGLALGIGGSPEFVITNEAGNMLDKNNWRRRVFDQVLKEARMRTIRIHDLRHTYATLRISKGDNIADVSGQLGHHSVKLTLDVYFHWMPGKKKSEVDGLDRSIFTHSDAPQLHLATLSNKKGS